MTLIPTTTELSTPGRLVTKSRLGICGAILLASSAAALGARSQPSAAVAVAGAAIPASADTPAARARRLALAPAPGAQDVDLQIRRLAHAADKLPRKSATWVALGQQWVRKARESSDPGYYLNAGACADVALELAPEDRLALGLRGLVLLNQHAFGEARALAQRILEQHPDDVTAWGTLSDAALELGDMPAAVSAAERMLALKPSLPSYSRAAHLRWLSGDDPTALELTRLAIDAAGAAADREPRAWMLVQAGMLFWHRGDYEGADAGFVEALEVMENYPPALVGRGRVRAARGDYSGAAALYEQAWKNSPLVETAWLWGEALELSGNAGDAQRAYAAAAREGDAHDARTLSLMYSTRNVRPDEALRLARAERATRADLYTEDVLAWALYRNGELAEARAAIDRARAVGTPDARLLFHQGAIYMAQGQLREGRALVERALARNPCFDATAAAEARRLLAEGRP